MSELSEWPVLEIDGATFDDLGGFADAVSELLDDHRWSGNLDAFNDILGGGFGTPDDFVFRWRNAGRSRAVLGYPETVRYLERKLARCHPSNRPAVQQSLDASRRGEGPTLFDIIVAIIREHAPSSGTNHGIVLDLT